MAAASRHPERNGSPEPVGAGRHAAVAATAIVVFVAAWAAGARLGIACGIAASATVVAAEVVYVRRRRDDVRRPG